MGRGTRFEEIAKRCERAWRSRAESIKSHDPARKFTLDVYYSDQIESASAWQILNGGERGPICVGGWITGAAEYEDQPRNVQQRRLIFFRRVCYIYSNELADVGTKSQVSTCQH